MCKHYKIYDEPPRCVLCGAFVCVCCGDNLRYPMGMCGKCVDAPTSGHICTIRKYNFRVLDEPEIGQIWQPTSPAMTFKEKHDASFRIDEVTPISVRVSNLYKPSRPRWISRRRLCTTRGYRGYELAKVLW